ncbi:uncharacterized protein LOC111436264 isoform X2 [Cucurbita moschata]|uniref:CASP-like protein n=1 Tax=Cucurbita moschata TaxID=3662 RepID=A0A6J1EPR9_CUCMO|nr:uncharacterized protein LOC111436264 isoform X2 [Cucurbita moschata]
MGFGDARTEWILRLCAIICLVLTVFLMGFDKETTQIFGVDKTASFRSLGALNCLQHSSTRQMLDFSSPKTTLPITNSLSLTPILAFLLHRSGGCLPNICGKHGGDGGGVCGGEGQPGVPVDEAVQQIPQILLPSCRSFPLWLCSCPYNASHLLPLCFQLV